MSARGKKQLLQAKFICPECGNFLAWALVSAEMSCPYCGAWVTETNRERDYEVYWPADDDQLVLFRDEVE